MLEIISKRKFLLNDQLDFSIFCGDKNPIHVDKIAARRTLHGQCIVHGVHALIWALDCLVKIKGITATKIKAKFIKPIFLNEAISCFWDDQKNQLSLQAEGRGLLASISITIGIINSNTESQIEIYPAREKPIELTFPECLDLSGQPFNVFGDITLADKLFPNFLSAYGTAVVAKIGGTSQIVGMECPGLHSLFASLKIDINDRIKSCYEVQGEERFNLLHITIKGSAITAEIEAFYRPAPTISQPLSEIAPRIKKREFTGVQALIIGGSRGLGELVAKIIAAGGGVPIITYNVGKIEAEKLAEEIVQSGGKCEIMQLTVGRDTAPSLDFGFNQLYYFATPKILGKRSNDFDKSILNLYQEIYVDAFNFICQKLIAQNHQCSVFYPSTIFVDSPPPEFKSYVQAKMEGEKLCETLNQCEILKVTSVRLPRLATDNNQSMLEMKFENATDLLIPLIRQMQNN